MAVGVTGQPMGLPPGSRQLECAFRDKGSRPLGGFPWEDERGALHTQHTDLRGLHPKPEWEMELRLLKPRGGHQAW